MSNRPIIKSSYSGRVPNEGNGMVGGTYAFCTRLAYKKIEIWPALRCVSARGDYEDIKEWFIDNYDANGMATVEAYFTVGYDHSGGVNSSCEEDERFLPEGFEDAVYRCPYLDGDEWIDINMKMSDMVDDIPEDEFEFYETDD